jgi:pimeloyl-ACP methyl ester carboxylesterase
MNRWCQFLWTSSFWLAAWMPVVARCQPAGEAGSTVPIGRLVDLGGYSLHLNATGSGQPVVILIAGAGDFSFDWTLVQGEASNFTSVCSFDRAGFAWSDLGPTPRTMKQEAYELAQLLKKAGLSPPYVLVGHSIGGLVGRVYATEYPKEVAGLVLVDSTHEDTTLMLEGKPVRVRDRAKARPIPPVQTMQSSPPKPPTQEDRKQADFNAQVFGPPQIKLPFDRLPPEVQTIRLWMLAHPKLSAVSDDFWPEELQALYDARARGPCPLGDKPLVVLAASGEGDRPPPSISPAEWSRLVEEKRKQKEGLIGLSRNSLLIDAGRSGHHIQLEQPELVVGAIRRVVEAVRSNMNLSETQ